MGGNVYCANTLRNSSDYMDCYKGETKRRPWPRSHGTKSCAKRARMRTSQDPRILKATALRTHPSMGAVSRGSMGSPGMTASKIKPWLVRTTGLDTDADDMWLETRSSSRSGSVMQQATMLGARFLLLSKSPFGPKPWAGK